MRLPSCLSTKDIDSRPSPLLPSSNGTRSSTIATYQFGAEGANGEATAGDSIVKPGCSFCDLSKEKGFAVIHEDAELIAFRDRSPRAKVHLLIIPRYHVADSVKALTENHVPLLGSMISLAHSLSRSLDPSTPPKLGFHIPPFSSVPHLHLHVLIPPYTLLGRLKYPISRREPKTVNGELSKSTGRVGKGWSWFVEAGQARGILAGGGHVKLGRS